MIEIEDKTIRLSRGDAATIKLTIPLSKAEIENYKFKIGDKIRFRVFEKKDYNNVVLDKKIIVDEESTEIDICISEEDSTIGETINKPQTYWYEISLNESQTIVGYDEDGPAEFILYPAQIKKEGE